MAHEFQAIILAGGSGERLHPLCETLPKPLLPIKNRPMIYYPLESVHSAGFSQVIVVTLAKWTDVVKQAVEKWRNEKCPNMEVFYRTTTDQGDSADAIRACADLLKKDFVVLGCDSITSVPLRKLFDHHRYHAQLPSNFGVC